MILDLLPLFSGVVLAQLAPGPNLMAVSANAMAGGRRAGLATAAAIGLGNALWAAAFGLGLGALITRAPHLLHWLSLAGGAYLLWLGVRAIWRAWRNDSAEAPITGSGRSASQAFRHGLLINVTNPKASLLWVSITVYIAGLGLTPGGIAVAVSGVLLSSLLVYGGYGLLFGTGLARRAYTRVARWIEGAFGIVFGALGAKLVIDGSQGLRG
ncbi:LysE family transporter [Gymnodinialimonas sp. 2305UL16-5]|uniref:LysE family translocator n=1 Tax=Gymnodinialimonas mytili TaxID=3126503 RepID=UPI0030B0C2E0